MTQDEAEKFIVSLGESVRDSTSQPGLVLFKNTDDRIFAVIHDGSHPLRLDAKCDFKLAKLLREKYETVLPSKVMEAATWNEIIATGQLEKDEIQDLLRLSYNLVLEAN